MKSIQKDPNYVRIIVRAVQAHTELRNWMKRGSRLLHLKWAILPLWRHFLRVPLGLGLKMSSNWAETERLAMLTRSEVTDDFK